VETWPFKLSQKKTELGIEGNFLVLASLADHQLESDPDLVGTLVLVGLYKGEYSFL